MFVGRTWGVVLLSSLLVIGVSCRCDKSPVEKTVTDAGLKSKKASSKKVRKMSPEAEELLEKYRGALKEQEEDRDRDIFFREVTEEERMISRAIDVTMDELLLLDPKKDMEHAQRLIEDLYNIGPKALEAVQMMLTEKRPESQKQILVMALGKFGSVSPLGKGGVGGIDDASEELLKQAVSAKSSAVREIALSNLKKSPDKERLVDKMVQEYDESFTDEKNNIEKQLSIVATLGVLGGKDAANKAQNIYETSIDPRLKGAAIESLGQIGDDYAKSVLYNIFKEDKEMGEAAAVALGKMKREEILVMFGETLLDKESSPEMKQAAMKGLGADESNTAREIVASALKDTKQNRSVHQEAINILLMGEEKFTTEDFDAYINVFEATQVDYLPQMMQPLLAKGGKAAISKLSSMYNRVNQTKKIHTIRTLGRIKGDEVFNVLKEKFSSEGNESLKREILTAMGDFRSDKRDTEIITIFVNTARSSSDPQTRITALRGTAGISPPNAAGLAEMMLNGQKNKDVQIAAIRILRDHGSGQSAGTLRTLLLTEEGRGLEEEINKAIEAIDARMSQTQ